MNDPKPNHTTMKRLLSICMLLALVLPMSSCRRAVEKARSKIRLEAIEKVQRQGLVGAEVVVRIQNGTGYKLLLDAARVDIYYSGSRIGTATLREGVGIEGRTTASVATFWNLSISNPLLLLGAVRSVQAGDVSQFTVSFTAEGRGGPAPVKIAREQVPMADILNGFGMTLQDVKNFLR